MYSRNDLLMARGGGPVDEGGAAYVWAFEAWAQDLTADTDHVVDKGAKGNVLVELEFAESEVEEALSDGESAGNKTINWLDVT